MRAIYLILIFLLCISVSAADEPAEETHPFTVYDMLAMDQISEMQVSPDGNMIVFTVKKTDLEADRRRSDLWLINTDGKGIISQVKIHK